MRIQQHLLPAGVVAKQASHVAYDAVDYKPQGGQVSMRRELLVGHLAQVGQRVLHRLLRPGEQARGGCVLGLLATAPKDAVRAGHLASAAAAVSGTGSLLLRIDLRASDARAVVVSRGVLHEEELRGEAAHLLADAQQRLVVHGVLGANTQQVLGGGGAGDHVVFAERCVGAAVTRVALDWVKHAVRGVSALRGRHEALDAAAGAVVTVVKVDLLTKPALVEVLGAPLHGAALLGPDDQLRACLHRQLVEAHLQDVVRGHHRGHQQVEQHHDGGQHAERVDDAGQRARLHHGVDAGDAQARHYDPVDNIAHVAALRELQVNAERLVDVLSLAQVVRHKEPVQHDAEADAPDREHQDEAHHLLQHRHDGKDERAQAVGHLEALAHLDPQQPGRKRRDHGPVTQRVRVMVVDEPVGVLADKILAGVQGAMPAEGVSRPALPEQQQQQDGRYQADEGEHIMQHKGHRYAQARQAVPVPKAVCQLLPALPHEPQDLPAGGDQLQEGEHKAGIGVLVADLHVCGDKRQVEQVERLQKPKVPPAKLLPLEVHHKLDAWVRKHGNLARRQPRDEQAERRVVGVPVSRHVGIPVELLHVVVHAAEALLAVTADPEVPVQKGGQQLGRLFHQQVADPGMLGPQQAAAVVVVLTVPADGEDVLEEHVRQVQLPLGDGPHDWRHHAVVHVNLERADDAALAWGDLQRAAKLVRAVGGERLGHEIAAGGDDVPKDGGNVAVNVCPATLDLLIPVVGAGGVCQRLKQHLAKHVQMLCANVILDVAHRDRLEVNLQHLGVRHAAYNQVHRLDKHHALHLLGLGEELLQRRHQPKEVFKKGIADFVDVAVSLNVLPRLPNRGQQLRRRDHVAGEGRVDNVPHPLPRLLCLIVPHHVVPQHLLEKGKQRRAKVGEELGLDAHLHVAQRQYAQLVLQNLRLGGAVDDELQRLAHLCRMRGAEPKVKVLDRPRIARCKNIQEGLPHREPALQVIWAQHRLLLLPQREVAAGVLAVLLAASYQRFDSGDPAGLECSSHGSHREPAGLLLCQLLYLLTITAPLGNASKARICLAL
mmetsp:Transcript_32545/g.84326  ORF Transcript_32545/g.84326 Transcript_32545/m.84326 type:complete len:1055 (-) Transcript_32545:344-3508(-)